MVRNGQTPTRDRVRPPGMGPRSPNEAREDSILILGEFERVLGTRLGYRIVQGLTSNPIRPQSHLSNDH